MKTALLALAAVLATAAPAAAAEGTVTIRLGRALAADGISAGGTRLAVVTGTYRAAPTLGLRGTLVLRHGTRSARFTALRATAGVRATTLSATLAGRRVTLLRSSGRATLDAAAFRVRLRPSPARLTADGARAIAGRLGLPRLAADPVATLAVDATLPPPEPQRPARPASAVDVTGASVLWHVRDSFVQYISTGEGISASRGATAEDATVRPGSDARLRYDFSFRFRDGWYDPVGGAANVRFSGRVRFAWKAHGIDLVAADPELELVPGTSRAVMRFGGASSPGDRRAVLVELAPEAPVADGPARTWAPMPGTLPAGTSASVFAGYYLPGDPFGSFALALRTG
jgi:hypothetical protein